MSVRRLGEMRLKVTNFNKTKSVVARPVISLQYFIPFTGALDSNGWIGLDDTALAMSKAIETYLDYVDAVIPSVRWEHWVGSYMKKVTRAHLGRLLHKPRRQLVWNGLEAPEEELDENEIGGYGLSALFSASDHTLTTWPKRTGTIRVDVPVTTNPAEVSTLFLALAKALPLQTAHAGYLFKEEPARWRGSGQVDRKLKQYLGFAPECGADEHMLGHTYTAHWQNMVSHQIMETLVKHAGGHPKFEHTQVQELDTGWAFTTSDTPLAGNIQKGRRELGGMVELAAFLRPLRATCRKEWLARFDGI